VSKLCLLAFDLDHRVAQIARNQLQGSRPHIQQPAGRRAGLAEEPRQQHQPRDLPGVLLGHDRGNGGTITLADQQHLLTPRRLQHRGQSLRLDADIVHRVRGLGGGIARPVDDDHLTVLGQLGQGVCPVFRPRWRAGDHHDLPGCGLAAGCLDGRDTPAMVAARNETSAADQMIWIVGQGRRVLGPATGSCIDSSPAHRQQSFRSFPRHRDLLNPSP